MNRRSWLTSLLALPLIPSVRAANVPDKPNACTLCAIRSGAFTTTTTTMDVRESGWIELTNEEHDSRWGHRHSEGGIELIPHEQSSFAVKPSKLTMEAKKS